MAGEPKITERDEQAADRLLPRLTGSYQKQLKVLARALAAARAEERERCAAFALDYLSNYGEPALGGATAEALRQLEETGE